MGSDQIKTENILFLHGFWGQASDWNFLKEKGFSKSYQALSYTEDSLLGPENFISDWGQNLLHWKKSQYGNQKIKAVGYSQGGRLLLHAFFAAPEEFEKVVLISSHPGLKNFKEKEERLQNDRKWARRFRTEDWPSLQQAWDRQGVFKGLPRPVRNPKDYDRETLALCFENWSLAHQIDFRNLINEHSDKIHIILGQQDNKYVSLYQDFLKDLSKLKIEKGAAHRVPFDQPSTLVEILNSII